MPIPIDIEKMLDSNIVEDERLEFKKGWNPEPILHTICAFANDIHNLGGGFIIVGMSDRGTVEGVEPSSIDRMNRDLLDLVYRISPAFTVESQCFELKGKMLFAIWAPSGRERPYSCPRSLSGKSDSKEVYIRKLASTVIASGSEIKELLSMSMDISFDDRPNDMIAIEDIDRHLIEEYLRKVNSKMAGSDMDTESILKKLRMTDTVYGQTCYRNVAAMFFCDEPDIFFENAVIEVTYRPDPTGRDMVEKVCRGPLDSQILQAVDFIKRYAIEQRTIKNPDTPVAERPYSYPLDAVEEAVTNAVLHKDYRIRRPVSIIIDSDRITIRSHPGPYRDITDEDLRNGIMMSDNIMNPRIGNILKELGLAEARNTGIPLIHQSMINNGSEDIRLETDEDRTFFKIVIPIHRSFLVEHKGAKRSAAEIRSSILSLLSEREMTVREISEHLGYKNPPSNLRAEIQVLISGGSIEYTSESANDPRQRLRLRR